MPGSPYMHAYDTTAANVGVGGADRVMQTNRSDSLAFFVWLIVIGVVIPVAILGGLQLGGFKFVYKGR